MITGIVNVYKEKGYTSFDVVACMRGILKTKKIGHTGTLDPDAQGVLPVCIGKATKVCDLLTDRDKEYEAVMLLGVETDTQDATGAVVARRAVTVQEDAVREALRGFLGEQMQVPPMYSALKQNGKKLCDLARAGVTVERKPRPVCIHEMEILDMQLPRVRFRVRCSKGTYIRTLCSDVGERLGCGACMESLLRTQASGFRLEEALRLAEIEKLVQKEAKGLPPEEWERVPFSFLIPVDEVFGSYERVQVRRGFEKMLCNGNRLRPEMLDGRREERGTEAIRIYDAAGHFVGVYQFDAEREDYKPLKVFIG